MLQDGEYANGWLGSFTEPDGTVKKVQAESAILRLLGLERRIIPADLAKTPMTARFFDTDTAAPWREDYSPAHPLSRSQDRDYRMQLLAYASQDLKLVNGSETGIDTAVPYLDYFEGMMSISEFRCPDFGTQHAGYHRSDSRTSLISRSAHNTGFPLFELVYHECVVNYWYWGDYNNKEPAVWQRRDLFNILYATPPVYICSTANSGTPIRTSSPRATSPSVLSREPSATRKCSPTSSSLRITPYSARAGPMGRRSTSISEISRMRCVAARRWRPWDGWSRGLKPDANNKACHAAPIRLRVSGWPFFRSPAWRNPTCLPIRGSILPICGRACRLERDLGARRGRGDFHYRPSNHALRVFFS